MHFRPLVIRVLLQNDDYVKSLEQQLQLANERAVLLKQQFDRLQSDYMSLSVRNLEIIDTLKANGIKYRKGLDGEGYWAKG